MDIFGYHFLSLEILCDCTICNYPMNLSEHRREVEDYMFALLSDEELKEAYGDYRESIGEAVGEEKNTLKSIRNVMETLDVSVEKAMDILKIPADKRGTFQEKINQE